MIKIRGQAWRMQLGMTCEIDPRKVILVILAHRERNPKLLFTPAEAIAS
jgi:hypothetical protein